MELCKYNMARYRDNAALCVSEQIELMEQVAAGCAWVARSGGIHGNLKMENILISETMDPGRIKRIAKVADFGLGSNILPMVPETEAGHLTESSDVYTF
eukprot:3201121-Amphidinium_carterae.1